MNDFSSFRPGTKLTLKAGGERIIIFSTDIQYGTRYATICPFTFKVCCHWYDSIEELMEFYWEIVSTFCRNP